MIINVLIKYTKSVLWRVAERLSFIQDAWCLKFKFGYSSNVSIVTIFVIFSNCRILKCSRSLRQKQVCWKVVRETRIEMKTTWRRLMPNSSPLFRQENRLGKWGNTCWPRGSGILTVRRRNLFCHSVSFLCGRTCPQAASSLLIRHSPVVDPRLYTADRPPTRVCY